MTETEAAAAANGAEATEKKPEDLSPEHLAKIDRQINVRFAYTACKFFALFPSCVLERLEAVLACLKSDLDSIGLTN
jgi:hypothetical protein